MFRSSNSGSGTGAPEEEKPSIPQQATRLPTEGGALRAGSTVGWLPRDLWGPSEGDGDGSALPPSLGRGMASRTVSTPGNGPTLDARLPSLSIIPRDMLPTPSFSSRTLTLPPGAGLAFPPPLIPLRRPEISVASTIPEGMEGDGYSGVGMPPLSALRPLRASLFMPGLAPVPAARPALARAAPALPPAAALALASDTSVFTSDPSEREASELEAKYQIEIRVSGNKLRLLFRNVEGAAENALPRLRPVFLGLFEDKPEAEIPAAGGYSVPAWGRVWSISGGAEARLEIWYSLRSLTDAQINAAIGTMVAALGLNDEEDVPAEAIPVVSVSTLGERDYVTALPFTAITHFQVVACCEAFMDHTRREWIRDRAPQDRAIATEAPSVGPNLRGVALFGAAPAAPDAARRSATAAPASSAVAASAVVVAPAGAGSTVVGASAGTAGGSAAVSVSARVRSSRAATALPAAAGSGSREGGPTSGMSARGSGAVGIASAAAAASAAAGSALRSNSAWPAAPAAGVPAARVLGRTGTGAPASRLGRPYVR